MIIRESTDEEFKAKWFGTTVETPSEASITEVQQILDAAEELPSVIDSQIVKKTVLQLDKAISRNQQLRMRFSDDPLKFVDAEADLAAELKNMTRLSAAPELYPQVIALNAHKAVVELLAHDNSDIVLLAIALLDELTDEDVVTQTSVNGLQGMNSLIQSLVKEDCLSLLATTLDRLNEDSSDDEKQGVFNILSVFENLVGVDPSLAERIVNETNLLPWLLSRVSVKTFDSVRQYATELMAILLQTSKPNRLRLVALGGIDTVLRVVAQYRRKDPKDDDEVELMENMFNVLCLCLTETEAKQAFLDCEGLELMLLMIKGKNMARMKALKTIDHALLGDSCSMPCAKFVEVLGLKTVFSAFMKKHARKFKKEYPSTYSSRLEDEHLVSIIASLFKHLSDPLHRERLVNKFVESDFEKSHQLLLLLRQYIAKMDSANQQIAETRRRREQEGVGEDEPQDDAEDYLVLLDAGLFTLQLVCFIMAYLCRENAKVKDFLVAQFAANGDSVEVIQTVLNEYANNLGNDEEVDENVENERERILLLSALLSVDAT